MGNKKQKIALDERGKLFSENPFAELSREVFPENTVLEPVEEDALVSKRKSKPRQVRMRREKTGRGGKEVTVLWDFAGLPDGERMTLLNTIKKRCGTGGKLLGQTMEIQGDQRDFLTKFLEVHDFHVIWSGG
jgi:translation initiation factor 1 (eIF-1/SUI1)